MKVSIVVSLCGLFLPTLDAFLQRPSQRSSTRKRRDEGPCRGSLLVRSAVTETTIASTVSSDDNSPLQVVLFGIGDLRTDDHVGLANALSSSSSSDAAVAAVLVLDEIGLTRTPGMVAHTADTVRLLLEAVDDLAQSLRATWDLDLQIAVPPRGVTVADVVSRLAESSRRRDVTVHVQDLRDADNAMAYGPYAQLASDDPLLPDHVTIRPWTVDLRDGPWRHVSELPATYPEYRARCASSERPTAPVDAMTMMGVNNRTSCVSSVDVSDALDSVFDVRDAVDARAFLDHVTASLPNVDPARVRGEVDTGLYMTHWGGLSPASVRGRVALDAVRDYLTDAEGDDDDLWTRRASRPGRTARRRNGRSLEHAAMTWQLRGRGGDGDKARGEWLPGEALLRWAAAPLLLGTLSPRRLWHLAEQRRRRDRRPRLFSDCPLQTRVESWEWYRLRAAHNMRTDPLYRTDGHDDTASKTTYRYWRYHGYLCRYAVTKMETTDDDVGVSDNEKQGILLVHGFGASGAQWNKAMDALSDDGVFVEGLAPDLIGFGEAEKPAISYTAYMWDSFVGDFIKERALGKPHGWDSFVLGGNSIGGFTSMSTAASDSAPMADVAETNKLTVTSSGAPGTGRCRGLVLMNSAGPIQTRDEVQAMLQRSANALGRSSVAQITALDALSPCSPPPRPVARAFGNALLTYLRPNIRSICRNLYPTYPAAVDDALCRGILRDSLDPGAVNVMMAGAKLPSPRSANELLRADFRLGQDAEETSVCESSFDGPVLVAQGVLDPLNDALDRMNRFSSLREGITQSPIQAGHCPHDELPEEVAQSISTWARTLVHAQSGRIASASK